MRVDRFLFFTRLMKSRTQAQGLIEGGKVRIDGRRAIKSSEPVKVGAVLAFPLHERVRVVRVLALPARRGPAEEARRHYEEIDEGASQS